MQNNNLGEISILCTSRRSTKADRRASFSRCLASFAMILLLAGCGDGNDGNTTAAPVNLDPNPALTIGLAQERPAQVVLPDDYDIAKRYPLVILLHGFGADAASQDFIFGLAARTTQDQFILALPNGTMNRNGQRFWDATPQCCSPSGTTVDDVGYLASLMREAMQIYAVDPQRIRLVGHSNGGYMAYRYICEHPVPVDRIAVLAGSTYIDPAACRDPAPVDVLHMHGTKDDTIPYNPNLPPQGNASKVYTVGAEAAVGRWAQVDSCSATPALIERRDYQTRLPTTGDPAETEILRYEKCRGGHSVELWRGNGADHIYLRGNDAWRDAVAAFLSQ